MFDYLEGGESLDEFLRQFPSVKREQAIAALDVARESLLAGGAHQDFPASKSDPAAIARLLDEWMRGDEAEQRETFEFLRRGMDEDRPEGYKLFP